MIRRWGCVLLLALATRVALCQASSAATTITDPGGLRVLGHTAAIVWSQVGASFKMWRLDAGGPNLSVAPVKAPAELSQQLKRLFPTASNQDSNYGYVDVETAGDEIRVLWFEQLPQSQADFERLVTRRRCWCRLPAATWEGRGGLIAARFVIAPAWRPCTCTRLSMHSMRG